MVNFYDDYCVQWHLRMYGNQMNMISMLDYGFAI